MKKRILLIDDEPQIRELLTLGLRRYGYDILEAGSGAEGKRKARERTPDLIISDLQLEDTDGLSLIGELKEIAPNASIILLTGVFFDSETVRDLLERNRAIYMQKTGKLQEILDEVVRNCPP